MFDIFISTRKRDFIFVSPIRRRYQTTGAMSTITSGTNLNSLKVPDLKKELKDRGIVMPASAKKSDLVAKLSEVMGLAATSIPEDLLAQTISQYAGDRMTSPSSINATLGSTISSIPLSDISMSSPIKSVPTVPTSQAAPGSTSPAVKKVVSPVSDPIAALAARAARFGGSVSSVAKTADELEALKKRADRFGVSVSPSIATLEEKTKLAQRASRFNIPESEQSKEKKPLGLKRKNILSDEPKTAGSSVKSMSKDEEEKLKKRKERFGSSI